MKKYLAIHQDKDEYENFVKQQLIGEREKDRNPVLPVKQELLRHRAYKVNLEFQLGKTTANTKVTPQPEWEVTTVMSMAVWLRTPSISWTTLRERKISKTWICLCIEHSTLDHVKNVLRSTTRRWKRSRKIMILRKG